METLSYELDLFGSIEYGISSVIGFGDRLLIVFYHMFF